MTGTTLPLEDLAKQDLAALRAGRPFSFPATLPVAWTPPAARNGANLELGASLGPGGVLPSVSTAPARRTAPTQGTEAKPGGAPPPGSTAPAGRTAPAAGTGANPKPGVNLQPRGVPPPVSTTPSPGLGALVRTTSGTALPGPGKPYIPPTTRTGSSPPAPVVGPGLKSAGPAGAPAPAKPAKPPVPWERVAGPLVFNPITWDVVRPRNGWERAGNTVFGLAFPNTPDATDLYRKAVLAGQAPLPPQLSADPHVRAGQVAELRKLQGLVAKYSGNVQSGFARATSTIPPTEEMVLAINSALGPGGGRGGVYQRGYSSRKEYEQRFQAAAQKSLAPLNGHDLAVYVQQQTGQPLTALQREALNSIAAGERAQILNQGPWLKAVSDALLFHAISWAVGGVVEEAAAPLMAKLASKLPAAVQAAGRTPIGRALVQVFHPAPTVGAGASGAAFQGLADAGNPNLTPTERVQRMGEAGKSTAVSSWGWRAAGLGWRAARDAGPAAVARSGPLSGTETPTQPPVTGEPLGREARAQSRYRDRRAGRRDRSHAR